ncbi:MAG: hypothetical protein JSR21_13875 [Proteobacteria bacterium]|nr:hypothetical protein [Pseudomonadota bacterium]
MPNRIAARPRLVLGAVAAAALAAGFAGGLMAAQPRMQTALRALEHAKGQLEQAEHDKAGYREQAIGFVDQAIGAVQKGIAAGAK